MRQKITYFLFSVLIILSGVFSVAPMAFCNMKASTPQSSCCKLPASSKAQCPICAYDLNKLTPTPSNISVKSHTVSLGLITILPQNFSNSITPEFRFADYCLTPQNDSSPPLFLRFCNFRS